MQWSGGSIWPRSRFSQVIHSVLVGAMIYWYAAAMWVLALRIHGRRERPLCRSMLSVYSEVSLILVALFGEKEVRAAMKESGATYHTQLVLVLYRSERFGGSLDRREQQ